MSSKTCFRCGEVKPLSEFYTHKRMADGHLNKCKECTKKDVHSRRHGDMRESVLAYDRARAKKPERVKHATVTVAKWRAAHPDRKAAQYALGRAVKTGRVTPLPCFVCGGKAEAHHPDYSRPLDVMWLCSAHHKQAHALAR